MANSLTSGQEASAVPDRGPRWRKDDTAPLPVITGAPPAAAAAPTAVALPPAGVPGGPEAPAAVAPGRHAKPPRGIGGWRPALRVLREVGIVLGIALLISVLIRLLIVQPFDVPTASMRDTLQPGDRVAAAKVTTALWGVDRGDVVVFNDPGAWLSASPPSAGVATAIQRGLAFAGLAPDPDDHSLVMRVIGRAGDKVACCDDSGRILLNGVPLKEAYLPEGMPTDQVSFDVTVPDGGVFVLGDNRAESRDSRYHLEENSGAVPVSRIVGRAVAVVWPLDHVRILGTPKAFAAAEISP